MELADDLDDLASRRKVPFAWDGSLYSKPHRGMGVDVPGLVLHVSALTHIIRHAPTGYPSQQHLRQVFDKLHEEHGVLGSNPNTDAVADRWRIMCKDILRLAEKDCDVEDELQEVVALIDLSITADDSQTPSGGSKDCHSEPCRDKNTQKLSKVEYGFKSKPR